MTLFLDDGDCRLYHGDVLQVLRQLPTGIAQTCVTSPPFYGLRDYGTGSWTGGNPTCDHAAPPTGGPNPERYTPGGGEMWRAANDKSYRDQCGRCGARRVDQQIGLEPTIHEYVDRIVQVFTEVWRVLRPDGTCWIELGDSYASQGGPEPAQTKWQVDGASATQNAGRSRTPGNLKPKDLIGVPWTVALALREAGWYLRSDIIWSRPNPMPESVTDRPTKSHSYIFLLSKQPRYYMDMDAIREPAEYGYSETTAGRFNGRDTFGEHNSRTIKPGDGTGGRNARSVWTIATQPQPEAHFATYPEELVRRCILAATSERGECAACGAPWVRETERVDTGRRQKMADGWDTGDGGHGTIHRNGREAGESGIPITVAQTTGWRASCTCQSTTSPQLVLDPFCGSGTTNLVARNHARRSIGIDLSEAYLEIAARRLAQQSLLSGATP